MARPGSKNGLDRLREAKAKFDAEGLKNPAAINPAAGELNAAMRAATPEEKEEFVDGLWPGKWR